ncbi:MAG TPA: lipase maturation factor family protein, partial [Parachlamydiaceae bacterium]|nr:lipase maturation factor family protein [Parachlamydiaceae bacterium]
VVSLGTFLSILLMLGVFPPLILLLLYILYLSIVSAGQDFLAFGWEGFLLEVTINAFFISLSSDPNIFLWISLNLVLFRFHFNGGTVKLQSRDPNWRNLTGVFYHYQSQPIPNAIAWYAYKLPMWFHKVSTFLMLFVEIIIPFGMFGPDWMRLVVFIAFVGLQLVIGITGNFSYLNFLTVALCLILLSNAYLPWFEMPPMESTSLPIFVLCTVAGIFLISLQLVHLWQHFLPNRLFQKLLNFFSPYHIANRYGIFAVMTTNRYEIIFEGSDDNENWQEYGFYYKPSEKNRRPVQISPYQPRLDWQAWFLPFGEPESHPWLQHFIYHLLKGSPEVIKLIRTNPFPSSPPKYVRTVVYDYVFTSYEEKRKSGCWWRREYVGLFTHSAHLRSQSSEV